MVLKQVVGLRVRGRREREREREDNAAAFLQDWVWREVFCEHMGRQ